MRDHIDIVAWLFMGYGALQLLGAVSVFLFLGGIAGLLAALGMSEGDTELVVVGGVYGAMALGIAALVAVFGVPYLVVGNGMRHRMSWSRIGGLVMGALAIMNMPLGTLLGVYAFVTLLDAEVAEEFA